jgi:DNA-binding CsgD family transcriptional regulator
MRRILSAVRGAAVSPEKTTQQPRTEMEHWTIDSAPRAPDAALLHGLTGIVGAIGRDDFAADALAALHPALAAASWSVYQVWRDRRPVMHLSASLGIADTTRECFRAYHDGLYRRDRSFDAVRRARRAGDPIVLRMDADDAPNSDHREFIYRRHGVRERLSVARLQPDGSLLAVNLYRHMHQPRYADGELAAFASAAPLLMAAVDRHVGWLGDGASGEPLPSLRAALLAQCPALTARELDICERLLRGLSYDGIAADLGLSVASVKTYRRRAFERLGLHFKSELFARFVAAGRDPVCRPLG